MAYDAQAGAALAAPPTWTFDQIMDQFLRWNARWAETTIPFAFYTARPAHLADDAWWDGFRAFSAAQQAATHRAFELIADVVELDFVEVADNQQAPGTDNGRITFAASTSFPAYATGAAYVDISALPLLEDQHRIWSSETLFNFNRWGGAYEPGSRNFSVLLHEILHGLGMPHPGEYNRNANEEILYDTHAEYAQDSGQYTVMSYFGAHETGAQHLGRFAATPLLHDVAAMQALYGANWSTRAGDTVYGFNSTAGREAFDFSVNTAPVVCVWDGGGQDLLDLSGYAVDQRVDLNAGAFSDVGGLTGNLAIALGAVIEHARGGSGRDTLIGNAADNRLQGGAGDDALDGGEGWDWAVFTGARDAYVVTEGAGGLTVTGAEGTDTIAGVEQLIFADALVEPGARVDIVTHVLHDPKAALAAASPAEDWLI